MSPSPAPVPSPSPLQPSRRRLLAGALAGGSLALGGLPRGGLFAAGSERIRIGLVGCGGRGTGAAEQAALAHPGVTITAVGDLFADHVAESAALLEAAMGSRFACPPERRFAGPAAWRRVLESDLDAVILAAAPWSRPSHVAAAIARGLHVYCEKPAATDVAGAQTVLAACAAAEASGLVVMSGLAARHHPATAATIVRIQAGAIGRPWLAECRASLGLPWHRAGQPGWTAEEYRQRNWVADRQLSGGPLVERHVDAIDRCLWALGDDHPVAAAPADATTAPAGGLAVRYRFADGRELLAEVVRGANRAPGRPEIVERVVGSRGRADLVGHRIEAAGQWAHEGPAANPWQAAMARFVSALVAGRGGDGGRAVCQSSLTAILGRIAVEQAREVGWHELAGRATGATPII
jgi:myo-inositol 2-dehydrogenase / D-chiro-inositol 1-dehydrogenase